MQWFLRCTACTVGQNSGFWSETPISHFMQKPPFGVSEQNLFYCPTVQFVHHKNTAQPPFLMIKSVFNTINIPVPRKPDFSNQMQILTLTDKLATIGDFFLNFCGTISNFPPSFNRINYYFNIYGLFSVCQIQITYHTQRLRILYVEMVLNCVIVFIYCKNIDSSRQLDETVPQEYLAFLYKHYKYIIKEIFID